MDDNGQFITLGQRLDDKRIAVIILTKNKVEMLFSCLYSIVYHNTYDKRLITIYICDTGSTKKNKERMAAQFERIRKEHGYDIRMIEEKSYHFSKNNNMVVRNHVGEDTDLILFMNNDVELVNDAIRILAERWNDSLGTLGARLMFRDDTIQHVGMTVDENTFMVGHIVYKRVWDSDRTEVNSFGNTGAFMMTSLDRFREIGGFNEEYEDVFQDVEYNLECIKMGYRNLCLTNAICWHDESQTRKRAKSGTVVPKTDGKKIVLYIANFMALVKNRRSKRAESEDQG